MNNIDEAKFLEAITEGVRKGITDLVSGSDLCDAIQMGVESALRGDYSDKFYEGVKDSLDTPMPSKWDILRAIEDGAESALRR